MHIPLLCIMSLIGMAVRAESSSPGPLTITIPGLAVGSIDRVPAFEASGVGACGSKTTLAVSCTECSAFDAAATAWLLNIRLHRRDDY